MNTVYIFTSKLFLAINPFVIKWPDHLHIPFHLDSNCLEVLVLSNNRPAYVVKTECHLSLSGIMKFYTSMMTVTFCQVL